MRRARTKSSAHRKPADPGSLDRVRTGVHGLDQILSGGLVAGGTYLLLGPPGAGKTILANQIAFNHAHAGGRVVYMTLLAESHARMLRHMRAFSFFDGELVGQSIVYHGAYRTLEQEGLAGLLGGLGQTILREQPTLLAIDGAAVADELAGSSVAFKKFVHELNSFASTCGCTVLMLSSSAVADRTLRPEFTMVDGIIDLQLVSVQLRTYRELEVRKFRGSDHLSGRHFVKITDQGFEVFPRTESLCSGRLPPEAGPSECVSTGIPGLDRMLEGGLVEGSTTILLGPAGVGKTSVGMHFLLEGAERGEPVIYAGFYECPDRLIRKADKLGLPATRHVESGRLHMIWHAPVEHNLDEIYYYLMQAIDERGARRLFLDGVDGLRDGSPHPERLNAWMAAFANELRSRNITAILTEETRVNSRNDSGAVSNLSAVTENLIFFRQEELGRRTRNVLSILKTRENGFDHGVREFTIQANKGVVIASPGPTRPSSAKRRGTPKRRKP